MVPGEEVEGVGDGAEGCVKQEEEGREEGEGCDAEEKAA